MLGRTLFVRTLQDRFFVLHDHFSDLVTLAIRVNEHSVLVQHRHTVEERNTFSSNLGLDRKFGGSQFQVLDVFRAEIFLTFIWIQSLRLQVLITVIDDTVHGLLIDDAIHV